MAMKESRAIAFYLIIFVTIFILNYIISIIYPTAKANNPIAQAIHASVIVFLLGYVLYSWKSNMSGFLKRIRATIPFALMFLIFIRIMGYGSFGSTTAGLIVCISLLLKTLNWKRHFAVILIPASISIILFKFFMVPLVDLDCSREEAMLRTTFHVAYFVSIFNFFSLYISKLVHAETPDLRAILIRTIKLSITVGLFFAAFLILNDVGDKKRISLPIQMAVNFLLPICFLVICYIFDISPVERKKKKNRISELRSELNDFYLEERAKIKK
ncbi:MAG: hypothetical protein ACYTFK_10590 [Planctomycetota bacterium]|jgi:hypothetical protein